MSKRGRRRSSMEAPSGSSTSSQTGSDPDRMSLKSDSSKLLPPQFGITKSEGSSETSSDPDRMSQGSDNSKDIPPRFGVEELERECTLCHEVVEDVVELVCGHRSCRGCLGPGRAGRDPAEGCPCPKCGKKLKTTKQAAGDADGNKTSKSNQRLKEALRQKYSSVCEGVHEQKTSLDGVHTPLVVIPGESEGPRAEHESTQLRGQLNDQSESDLTVSLSDIFLPSQEKPRRTVLTKGIAGIGKSFTVQKFTLDWAQGKTNPEVDFIFILPFRELNLCSGERNLRKLLTEFYPDLPDQMDSLDLAKTIVVLDGLDESRLPLDFDGNQVVTSVRKDTTVENLMVNLIQGNLLPNTKLWITSRPTAANRIPAKHVDMVTEILGFNDKQKEEYFQRKFSPDADLPLKVISHIRSSHILDIMCQIPIFSWISASLFQVVFSEGEKSEVPQTLTEMMAHFLFSQTKRKEKEMGKRTAEPKENVLTMHRELLLKLGKLAFDQLLKNSLIFYEKDLVDHGIDLKEESLRLGFCNTILKEEKIFAQKQVYFFVHLTVQEFLAALYVYDCFTKNKTEELQDFLDLSNREQTLLDLLKKTVDNVLGNISGHLDFFLQFLLGLLLEPNRRVLQGLLDPPDPTQDTEKKILTHLKSIRRKTITPDGSITLFQAMVEMRDHKVKDEIEEYLRGPEPLRTELSPLHCSALAYILQVSRDVLEELDLKRYNTTEEGRRRLIPAVRRSRTARLANCRVTERWVEPLVLALKFPHSPLRDLDLSNNDLKDSGVRLLCGGLSSLCCRLETLSLSGCMVSETGCEYLVSALRSNPSHLKDLDLSYNHPGDAGVEQLSQLRVDPNFALTQLKKHQSGSHRLTPGLKKYACDITLDRPTGDRSLHLSKGARKVSWVEKNPPETPEGPRRVLSPQDLKGRCYLEVQLGPRCTMRLAYAGVSEAGEPGSSEESWSFVCSDDGCCVVHGGRREGVASLSSRTSRLGVYLDLGAGELSFHRVSSESITLLHSYTETFREPLRLAAELQGPGSWVLVPDLRGPQ